MNKDTTFKLEINNLIYALQKAAYDEEIGSYLLNPRDLYLLTCYFQIHSQVSFKNLPKAIDLGSIIYKVEKRSEYEDDSLFLDNNDLAALNEYFELVDAQ